MQTGNFKELIVWQKSIVLVTLIYDLTRTFPADEKFGLVSQIRRASVSISSNIAEGHARRTTADFVRFISMAEGSLAEVETQLIIASQLGYSSKNETENAFGLMLEIRRMLNALRRKLMAKTRP